jgi:hypothetical protein
MDLIDVIEPMETADMESTSPRKIVLWGQDDLLSQSITRACMQNQKKEKWKR